MVEKCETYRRVYYYELNMNKQYAKVVGNLKTLMHWKFKYFISVILLLLESFEDIAHQWVKIL